MIVDGHDTDQPICSLCTPTPSPEQRAGNPDSSNQHRTNSKGSPEETVSTMFHLIQLQQPCTGVMRGRRPQANTPHIHRQLAEPGIAREKPLSLPLIVKKKARRALVSRR